MEDWYLNPFDGLWIELSHWDRKNLPPDLMQLDWILDGKLSRAVQAEAHPQVTFIHTQGLIPTPLIAIQHQNEVKWEKIRTTAEGLHWNRMGYLTEVKDRIEVIEKELSSVLGESVKLEIKNV